MSNLQRNLVIIVVLVLIICGGFLLYQNKVANQVKIGTPSNPLTAVAAGTSTSNPDTNSGSRKFLDDVYIIRDDGALIDPTTGQLNDVAVAKKFYQLYPNKQTRYDFLSIFTTFHTPNFLEGHFIVKIDSAGLGSLSNSYFSSYGLPTKLLGINVLNDTYNPTNIPNENAIKKDFWLLDHETGHQWLASIGISEGITDGMHYTKWANTGFLKNGQSFIDTMGGLNWKDDGNGTVSANPAPGGQLFSKISLYLMGFAPLSEVPDPQVVVPNNPNDSGYQNVPGTLKTISMARLVSKYGQRIPSYQNSQKNFNMAYILVIKRSFTQYQPYLTVLRWVAKDFPPQWNMATEGKSTINK